MLWLSTSLWHRELCQLYIYCAYLRNYPKAHRPALVSSTPPSYIPRCYKMPGLTTFPPFPENISSHPLLIIDYELLKIRDKNEIAKLWKAVTELGFW